MSCYVIYYENGAKMMRPVLTEAEYRALRGSEKQRHNRLNGNKNKLVQMNYSCVPDPHPLPSPVEGEGVVTNCGPLKGCKRESNSVGMDVDFDPADPAYEQKMAAVPQLVLSKKDELGLLMLERSVRKGYHIVFKRRAELSQEENLRWASDLLGVQYDEGAKDITRVFFTTTDSAEDLLFLDQKLFSSEELRVKSEELGVKSEELGASLSEELGVKSEEYSATPNLTRNVANNSSLLTPHSSLSEAPNSSLLTLHSSLNYQGIEYAMIIKKYLELFHNSKEPCEGNRNVMTFELAMMLRSICDYSQAKLEQVIPRYDNIPEEEWRQCIVNAVKEPQKGMPYRLRQVLSALKTQQRQVAMVGVENTPPPLPKKLPPLIAHLTKNVPEMYKPAVASAVFAPLAVHMHGVKFRYWDNVDHEPTFMNVLVGPQSVGKGCIKMPIEIIMEDIKRRDEPNRRREAEWKRNNPTGKAKAKDPRPTDICIQMLVDNLTDAVFNQRIVDAHNNGQRFVYTIVDEVEGLKKVTSRNSVDEVTLLIRKAFDNAMAGQERVGADSVSGIAPLRWNWNASTTPPNARRFFGKAVNDGTLSRLDVATIRVEPQPLATAVEGVKEALAPVFGIYDDAFREGLMPYLQRLDAASGLIECPQSKALAIKMREENEDLAKQMESEAYRILSYRANVIAWLKGMLLYVAHGYTWSQEIADFVHWSQQYNLWCKMLYFGDQLEKELDEETEIQNHRGPQNMLMLLPEEFSKQEYQQLRTLMDKKGDGETTLRVWLSRKHIAYDEISERYINLKKIKSAVPKASASY